MSAYYKKEDVTNLLRGVYNSYHNCALYGRKAIENKVAEGTMCDCCEDLIKNHLENLEKGYYSNV